LTQGGSTLVLHGPSYKIDPRRKHSSPSWAKQQDWPKEEAF